MSDTEVKPETPAEAEAAPEPAPEPVQEQAEEPAKEPDPTPEPAAPVNPAEPAPAEETTEPVQEPTTSVNPAEPAPTIPSGNKPFVLVTGASSYVGQWCIKTLLEDGHRVRSTMRSITDEEKVKNVRSICELASNPENLELVEGDLVGEQEQWDAAVNGVEWVFHVASPLPGMKKVKNPQEEVIDPAIKGTTLVIKAAAKTPSVKKLILTSSCYATQTSKDKTFTVDADLWMDPEKEPALSVKNNPYAASKVLAEKEGYRLWNELTDNDNKFEMASILPGVIYGPLLDNKLHSSPEFVSQWLNHSMSKVPNVSFGTCDVRDVARAHIIAATKPECVGKRFIIVTEVLSMLDACKILDAEFKPQGYKVTNAAFANWMVKMVAMFKPELKTISLSLGYNFVAKNEPMKEVLGMEPRPLKDAVLATAYSVIEKGLVEKKEGYKLNEEYYPKQ